MKRQSSLFTTESTVSRNIDDSAYDNVKIVADNIDSVVPVGEALLDNSFNVVTDNVGSVVTVAGSISAVNLVSDSISTITAVALNETNIGVVAGIDNEITSLVNDKATLDSLYADKATLDSIFADKATLDSLFSDKATLDSLYADKSVLDSIFANKPTLDSLYSDKTILDRLYTSITNIDRVFSSINNLDRVFTSISNLDRIFTSVDNIDTVSSSIANVNTTALNITDVGTVATDIVNVNTASTNIAEIVTVSTDIASVITTATNISAVTTTSSNISDVVTASTNINSINTVAADLNEPVSEIETVASNITNVNIVGTNVGSVNTVATNISDVNNIVTEVIPNMAEILLADNNAANASASATEAEHWANFTVDVPVPEGDGTTEFSAKHWASKAAAAATGSLRYLGSWDATTSFPIAATIGDYYKVSVAGPEASAPYTYNSGDSIIYNGSGWDLIDSSDAVSSVDGQIGAVNLSLVYEPKDTTILKDADIGVNVQAYNANTVIDGSYVHTDNNYTTTEKNKLAGIENNATADQTDAEISALMKDYTETLTNKTLVDYTNVVHADALHIRVKATESILKGQALTVTGWNSGENAQEVALANQATGVANGVATENMLSGEFGLMVATGVVRDIDTSTFSEGQILYLDGSGSLTATEPTSGFSQPLAYVLRSNSNNGAIQVNAAYPKQDAADVRVAPSGAISSTTVQTALEELQNDIDNINDTLGTLVTEVLA